ncbi:MAG: hypothetical protein JXA46_17825 [Dehalococcoidales bacterium]|nr:hypothetical protein [Dehalococcoidales bacterium]
MDTKWMPTVAGILNIVVGSLSLVGGILSAFLIGAFFSDSYDHYSGQGLSALMVWMVIFTPLFIISLLALAGGIFSLLKKTWGMALAGSIAASLTLWACPLGIISIVFVAISRYEFDRNKPLFHGNIVPPSSSI